MNRYSAIPVGFKFLVLVFTARCPIGRAFSFQITVLNKIPRLWRFLNPSLFTISFSLGAIVFVSNKNNSASIYREKLARFYRNLTKKNLPKIRKSLSDKGKIFLFFPKRASFYLRIFAYLDIWSRLVPHLFDILVLYEEQGDATSKSKYQKSKTGNRDGEK